MLQVSCYMRSFPRISGHVIGRPFTYTSTPMQDKRPNGFFSTSRFYCTSTNATPGTTTSNISSTTSASAPLSTGVPPPTANSTASNPFVSAMLATNNIHLTENLSYTHKSSQDARLDLFSQLVPTIQRDHALQLFERSWAQSPLDTLKLIFHAGAVRDGKSDKKSFLHGLWWLSQHHPRTLLANLRQVPLTTCWKDLLTLLQRLNVGEEQYAKGFDNRGKTVYKNYTEKKKAHKERRKRYKQLLASLPNDAAREAVKAERKKQFEEETKMAVATARAKRHALAASRHSHTNVCRLSSPIYQKIEEAVALLFAEQIRKDKQQLDSESKKKDISLAGKWAPSFGGCFDKYTGISLLILRKLVDQPISGSELTANRARVYTMFHRFLTPLRNYIQIPEKYMSAKKWNELPYNRVPSLAMKLYKKLFVEHDKKRFAEYIEELKKPTSTKKIASGALLPHEILHEATTNPTDATLSDVSELQWRSYVDRLAKTGSLKNMLPVCDVSGSMGSVVSRGKNGTYVTNMHVSIAISLLIAELTAPPFNNLVCTFSSTPQFHKIEGNTLSQKYHNLSKADWSMSTNYQAIFDLILQQAKAHKLSNDQMIKTLVVLSDMEFDSSTTANNYETDHMQAERKFAAAGYTLPEIIYWNLAARHNPASVPVTKDTVGVSLLSGFSGNQLELFMDNPNEAKKAMNPIVIMEKALKKKLFENLIVVD